MSNTKKSFSQAEEIRRFFWNVAGTDIEILKQCSKSEQNKYFGIGFLIFVIAIIAAFSGGYAVYTTTGNNTVSFFLGGLWGLLILNVDRLLVATMKKTHNNNKIKEFVQAIPRFILAIAIAFVVSKPVEVKLLEPQINKFILETNQEKIIELNQAVEDENNVEGFENELNELEERDSLLNAQLNNLPNHPRVIQIRNELNTCETNWQNLQNQINRHEGEREAIRLLRYEHMVEEVEVWNYNGRRYSEVEFNEEFESIPSGASRNSNDVERRMNDEGRRRRWQLLQEINSLRQRQRNLGCGSLRTSLSNEIQTITNELNSDIAKSEQEKERTDSVFTEVQEVVQGEQQTNREVLENASMGFVGKLIALERLKDDENYSFYESSQVEEPEPEPVQDEVDVNAIVQDSLRQREIRRLQNEYPIFMLDTIDKTNRSGGFSLEEPKRYILEDLYNLEAESNEAPDVDSEVEKDTKGKNTAWWLSLALMFFFMCLEVLPVSAKILANYGSYDAKVEKQEQSLINNA